VYGEAKDAAFRYASAFVLPSFSEGLPMSVLEAWSYGLPVFMTEACGLSEGFTSGAAIEITTDPETMADRFIPLLSDEASLSVIGQRGKNLVAQHFTWERAATAMREVYDWLAGSGPRPAFVV
jgi:poly(glycerol-phosphate) alpha-glucosyltransferase